MVDLAGVFRVHNPRYGQMQHKCGPADPCGWNLSALAPLCVDLRFTFAHVVRAGSRSYQSYTYFGLDHVASCLLGESLNGAAHNAVGDAIKSMRFVRDSSHTSVWRVRVPG